MENIINKMKVVMAPSIYKQSIGRSSDVTNSISNNAIKFKDAVMKNVHIKLRAVSEMLFI